MKAKTYTVKGVAKEDMTLPKEYKVVSNVSLLAQAVRVYEDRTHFGLNKVKTRSEINATKKKLYKQKGTGGARHGAKSAHIFVGGGVVHGPTGMKRDLKMPIKMKKKALLVALSNKFADKKAVLIEGINKIAKTSEASKMIVSLKKTLEVKSKVLLVLANSDAKYFKFFANINDLDVVKFSDLNAFLVLKRSLVLIDSSVFNVQKEAGEKKRKK
jgi:large subunit ribosomal protein L4